MLIALTTSTMHQYKFSIKNLIPKLILILIYLIIHLDETLAVFPISLRRIIKTIEVKSLSILC